MILKLTIIFVVLISLIFSVTAQYEYPDGQIHSVIIEQGGVFTENYPKEFSFNNPEQPVTLTTQKGAFTLTILADFTMAFVWIYNNLGIDNFVMVDDSVYSIDLPVGTYNVFTGFAPTESQHTIIILDSIELNSPTQLRISRENARFSIKYQLVRENFDALRINTIAFYFFNNILNKGLRITHRNFDSTAFVFRYNKISNYFKGEWAVKGKQLANQGNLYLLNNEFKDFGKDTVIINDPANFAYADFNIQLFTFIPDFHTSGIYDPYYNYPIDQRIYQDTSANLELNSSIFWQGLNAVNILYDFVNTSEIRIGQTKVNGYFYGERQAPSFVISENKDVHIGLTPTYWFGKFINENDTIKIRSPYGKWEYLFLSQANDILRHYPIDYQLYRNNTLIQGGQFNLLFGPVALRLGFNVKELTFPVPTDKYKILISDSYNEVDQYKGISKVEAEFDLRSRDKNPPSIELFQILTDDKLANILSPTANNLVRFLIEDEAVISSIQLFYSIKGDTIYYTLPVNYSDPYFQSSLPLLEENYYSLRLVLKDTSNNKIDCLMEPAFHMLPSTFITNNISEKRIRQILLFPNYPNPFNFETTISFYIPPTFRDRVNLALYNILGEQIKDYSEIEFITGLNKIKWTGLDEMGQIVSSGIYFVILKGGDFQQAQKILLIK
ncbi:MAG: T9SS type A sorting domain-containing protein [Ignavibacteriaceae bacterium]